MKMKKQVTALVAGAVAAIFLLSATGCGGGEKPDRDAAAFDNAQATLKITGVDESASGDISQELYGVFLEDINYASYALDDNMVKNGSFQSKFSTRTAGWKAGGGATLTAATEDSLLGDLYKDYANQRPVADYAKLVTAAGGTLTNDGYDDVPMAVKEGVNYVFSAFIRAEGVQNMTVAVTDGETDYCTASIALSGSGWKKYQRTMTASGTKDEDLKLKLTSGEAGTVSLDGVTLETTDSTVGVKNYLYEAVEELGPKFIRFPGGCITEGENYNANDEQAYDWKNSIGAVANGANAGDDTVPAFTYTLNTEGGEEQKTTYGEFVTRETNTNLWQNDGDRKYYQMEYGLGFYEYFMLCDSLGASALPVVNCGLSCQGQTYPIGTGAGPLPGRHNKQIADYIRDAADLIEFAKGDKTTKWGAIRAAMGHEAPFEMNYIGIGNEQWNAGEAKSNYFTTYYEKFLENDYFMEKCEEYGVQLIVGNHQQLVHCEGSLDFSGTTPTPRTTGVAREAALAYMNAGKISSLGEYGVQDHHYYNSPVDFFLHAHMYDNYTRTGANRYEVFVGEYSANNTFREAGDFSSYYEINNWFSALSEAAAMTGFERNGDIVKLSAYAPMFAPVNAAQRDWAVDMMLFTNTELVRTANYYVQQIFMKNAGTKKLNSELTFADNVATTVELTGTGKKRAIDRLYYVASVDEATGDYILKIVNADEVALRLNIDLGGAKITGIAAVTKISAEYDDVNELGDTPVLPAQYTVGNFTNAVAGVKLAPASVTAIRFHTK